MTNDECRMADAIRCNAGAADPSFVSAPPSFVIRHSSFPRPSRLQPPASGLTLVELLITMTIMAIIAAMILGTAQAAMESARRSRTQQTIHKIHGLIMERLELYSTRRVDFKPAFTTLLNNALQSNTITHSMYGQIVADLRLLALREMMKYEMPDRWSDVRDANRSALDIPEFLVNRPALAQSYLARWNQMTTANPSIDPSESFEGPECLYLTVMNATGDGEARTLFTKQEIGDVDGDGTPEFLDGWGQPIGWIRWPAGFVPHSQLMTGDANTDHDPFDMYRRDMTPTPTTPALTYPPGFTSNQLQCLTRLHDNNPAFRLVPLIYSLGPDDKSDYSTIGLNKQSDAVSDLFLDPYALESPGQPYDVSTNHFVLGTAGDPPGVDGDGTDDSKDNISNHLIEK
jgi:prepilin-type N-terminal cleavage/methylation domain-containing protein